MTKVSDLVIKNDISFSPEMSLIDAINILSKHKFAGSPVINSDMGVVGVLSEPELFIKDTNIHLPTLLKILGGFDMYKARYSYIRKNLDQIFSMKVKDAMNSSPIIVKLDTSIEEVTKIFSEHPQINLLPVVNEYNKFVGTLSQYDIDKIYSKDSPNLSYDSNQKRELDDKINKFLSTFANDFMFVSKYRIKSWLLFSLSFLIIGFFVATIAIINVNF